MESKLKTRRIELGLTLEQVGDLCGVGKSTVRKWENGIINNMGRDKIILLSKALKVSPLYILESESCETLLSKYDMKLLSYTTKLNNTGKNKVLEYAEDLSSTPLYCIDRHPPLLQVAHARTDIEQTPEGIAHDLALMEDDSNWE